MKMDVFGKRVTTKSGKSFYNYFGKLTKKDGEEVSVAVKFKEEAGEPTCVPCTISFEKKDVNLATKTVTYEVDNETKSTQQKTLWVSNYVEEEYVDNSMDDFI